MAKVQGKKAASSRKPVVAVRKPAVKKPVARTSGKPASKKPVKPAARAKAVAKKVVKTVEKLRPKTIKTAAPAPKPVAKPAAAPKPAPRPVPAPPPPPVAARPKAAAPPKEDDKKRRRSRTRVSSNGTPVAAWLSTAENKPRPSSFIPAPPRAEAPSLVAAPPASSDRLVRAEDVIAVAVRTVPVRVDIEMAGGRSYLGVNPIELTLRVGEGIEWDFRYLGGADVTADEIVIEFEKPSPFTQSSFRSRKPGTARPHRQLSGPSQQNAAGRQFAYTIKAMTQFKTVLAAARGTVSVVG